MKSLPVSSGFIRGGANANPNWQQQALAAGKWFQETKKALEDAGHTVIGDSVIAKKIDAILVAREQSQASGYTGDPCSNCQNLTLRISGHCYVCDTCGSTTGCS